MTPAIELLKKKKISFQLASYEHDPHNTAYGVEAADKLGVNACQVFKTLLVMDEKKHLLVAVIPVLKHLDLKQLAHYAGVKKLELAKPDIAQKITGYLVGGISPLGQKKQLSTFIDKSALQYTKIYVSGGRRGLDIALAPQSLIDLTQAQCVEIIKE